MSASAKKSETLEPTGSSALAALLSSPSLSASSGAVRRAGPLVAELGEQDTHSQVHPQARTETHTPTQPQEEGPTLLEQMMAEQRLAMQSHRETQAKQQQKEAKKSFGGFKKGFFGSSSAAAAPTTGKVSNNSSKATTTTNAGKSTSAGSANIASSSSSQKTSEGIVEIKARAREGEAQRGREKGVVLEEVQTAMQEDNPLLAQLRSNEWVTPDLTAALQTNPVLSRGFRDPKCLAAVELMQKDPQAAKERFQRDAEVALFLQEFGKVMSAHFEKLSLTQQQPQKQKEIEPHKPIEEIGPLQAQALQKEREKEKAKETQNKTTKGKATTNEDADQARVQQILNDPELRELLMDAELQRILVECGDPVMLREHMKNPSTVRKIQKLQRAGLVQMQI